MGQLWVLLANGVGVALVCLMLSWLLQPKSGSRSQADQQGLWWSRSHQHPGLRRLVLPCSCRRRPEAGKNTDLASSLTFEDLPSTGTPVLAFVNRRSGGNQGEAVLRLLRRYLNPIQVVDLSVEQPEARLKLFMLRVPRLRLLVCGGDGTVGWALAALDRVRADLGTGLEDALTPRPPVAILPLGTGNDLARCLGWGGGFVGESIEHVLLHVARAITVFLDRWCVELEPDGESLVFNNYMGLGVDASATLNFHNLREAQPGLFRHRALNKLWYALLGGFEFLRPSQADFAHRVTVRVDGHEEALELPEGCEGVVFMNINSFAAGVRLWSHDDRPEDALVAFADDELAALGTLPSQSPSLTPPSLLRVTSSTDKTCMAMQSQQDRLLDVVAVHGTAELGAVQLGLPVRVHKLCQCRRAEVTIQDRGPVPVELDGEPRLLGPGRVLRVECAPEQAEMLQRAVTSADDIGTEVEALMEWASRTGVLTDQQSTSVRQELSKRLERWNRSLEDGGY